MPAGYAQTRIAPDTRATMIGTPAALSIQPDQVRASMIIGSTVYDVQNRDIGSVKLWRSIGTEGSPRSSSMSGRSSGSAAGMSPSR